MLQEQELGSVHVASPGTVSLDRLRWAWAAGVSGPRGGLRLCSAMA